MYSGVKTVKWRCLRTYDIKVTNKYKIFNLWNGRTVLQHKHNKHLKLSYRKFIFPDWDMYQTVTYEKRQECAIKTIVTAVQDPS